MPQTHQREELVEGRITMQTRCVHTPPARLHIASYGCDMVVDVTYANRVDPGHASSVVAARARVPCLRRLQQWPAEELPGD